MKKVYIKQKLSEAVGSKLQCAGVGNSWTHPTTGEPFTTIKVHAKDLKEYFNVSLYGKIEKTDIPEDAMIDFDDVELSVDVQARNGFQGQAASARSSFKFAARAYVNLDESKKPENKKPA